MRHVVFKKINYDHSELTNISNIYFSNIYLHMHYIYIYIIFRDLRAVYLKKQKMNILHGRWKTRTFHEGISAILFYTFNAPRSQRIHPAFPFTVWDCTSQKLSKEIRTLLRISLFLFHAIRSTFCSTPAALYTVIQCLCSCYLLGVPNFFVLCVTNAW